MKHDIKPLHSIMDAISSIIPLTIVSGLFLAFSNTLAFQEKLDGTGIIWEFPASNVGILFEKMYEVGQIGFMLMIPLFSMNLARAIGGKHAMIPAFIGGYLVNSTEFLGTRTGSGFFGAILIGFFVGYLTIYADKIQYPALLTSIVELLFLPLLLTFVVFIFVYYVIGHPLSNLVQNLYVTLNYFTVKYSFAPFIYGAILGAMIGFDLGGPMNKTAGMVASAIFIDTMNQFGIEGVNALPQAATAASISVAPIGAGIASLVFGELFDDEERSLGSSAIVMGMFGISEGSIPFIIRHPQLIIANTLSSALSGGLIAGSGIQFFGGIGSPLGAFVGYTSGPRFSSLLWFMIIVFSSVINAILYKIILTFSKSKI